MDDIVEQLRYLCRHPVAEYSGETEAQTSLLIAAADEIERLREYVASSASAGCATAKSLLSENT